MCVGEVRVWGGFGPRLAGQGQPPGACVFDNTSLLSIKRANGVPPIGSRGEKSRSIEGVLFSSPAAKQRPHKFPARFRTPSDGKSRRHAYQTPSIESVTSRQPTDPPLPRWSRRERACQASGLLRVGCATGLFDRSCYWRQSVKILLDDQMIAQSLVCLATMVADMATSEALQRVEMTVVLLSEFWLCQASAQLSYSQRRQISRRGLTLCRIRHV